MLSLAPFVITKMSGAGNTFALIDARSESSWMKFQHSRNLNRSFVAKHICDPVLGLCADGVLFIGEGSLGYDYDWDFYNSDGSTAEMCGNAARCAARFCSELFENNLKLKLDFKTGAGLVTTTLAGSEDIRVTMPEAAAIQYNLVLATKSAGPQTFDFVNTGVPHLVQKLPDLKNIEALKPMAQEARSHRDLHPKGANVTFYAETSPQSIDAVTFERGVEGYTLACGTGAVAAAMVHAKKENHREVIVQMPGGSMRVLFSPENPRPMLVGTALFIGEFKYNIEVFDEKF